MSRADFAERVMRAGTIRWLWLSIRARSSLDDGAALRGILHEAGLATREDVAEVDALRVVTRERAKEIIEGFLRRNLDYRMERMPALAAAGFAAEFVSEFADGAVFRSNLGPSFGPGSYSWSPLTQYTFDLAVVGLDATTAGVICVADEDGPHLLATL